MMRLTNLVGANVAFYSFGSTHPRSTPVVAKYMINVTHFRDPLGKPEFRNKQAAQDGRAGIVQDWMKADPRIGSLVDSILMILRTECPNVHSTTSFISFALHDHHGRWASPALVEMVADQVSSLGWNVGVVHYDVTK